MFDPDVLYRITVAHHRDLEREARRAAVARVRAGAHETDTRGERHPLSRLVSALRPS